MTTDRSRRSSTIQLELPLPTPPAEVARAAKALKAAKAVSSGKSSKAGRAGSAAGRAGSKGKAAPAGRSAPGQAGDWRLDEQTRRIGRQGVAAARALLGDTGAPRRSEDADGDRRRPGRAA